MASRNAWMPLPVAGISASRLRLCTLPANFSSQEKRNEALEMDVGASSDFVPLIVGSANSSEYLFYTLLWMWR